MKHNTRILKIKVQLDDIELDVGDKVTVVYPPDRFVLCHHTGWYEIDETYLEPAK